MIRPGLKLAVMIWRWRTEENHHEAHLRLGDSLRDKRLDQLKYYIIPGRMPPDSIEAARHDQIYVYWRDFWNDVFTKSGAVYDQKFQSEFSQMNLVVALMSEEKIAGVHLYRFFDLRRVSHRERDQFASGGTFVAKMLECGIQTVMTLEYLTIDPGWRKRETGVSLATVLGSLATRVQRAIGIDACTGICRLDVGVDRMFHEIGGMEMGERRVVLNTPVTFMAAPSWNSRDVSDAKTKEVVDRLWKERIDYSSMTLEKPRSYSAA